jgi:phosphatidylserine decarboxylase
LLPHFQIFNNFTLPLSLMIHHTHRFVVVSLLSTRFHTPVCKRAVNPTYSAKDATFDFPIYLSLADELGAVELVVWDKDMITKDYLGEVAIPLEDWFSDSHGGATDAYGFDDPNKKVRGVLMSYD